MVSTDMEPEPYTPLTGTNVAAKRSLDIFQVPEEQGNFFLQILVIIF